MNTQELMKLDAQHENADTCPICKFNPISQDDGDLREFGYCRECIEDECKRIAPYERKEYEYVFGDAQLSLIRKTTNQP